MTIASCGSVSAITLGLPNSTAISSEKATLPKGLFVAKVPVSAKTKQRLATEVESITMLSLLRPQNTSLAAGNRIPEILVLGLRLHGKNASVPTDVVELIAMQRKSGMLFACVRDAEIDGTVQKECAFAVRRALPGTRPGILQHSRSSPPHGFPPMKHCWIFPIRLWIPWIRFGNHCAHR